MMNYRLDICLKNAIGYDFLFFVDAYGVFIDHYDFKW
jgi:hypothetical protein